MICAVAFKAVGTCKKIIHPGARFVIREIVGLMVALALAQDAIQIQIVRSIRTVNP